MLGVLDGIEDYNNAGALLGLDAAEQDALLGALRRMNPIQRQRAINKLANTGGASRGSRAEMEKNFNELPPHIKDGLLKGELRLADTIVYSIKPVTSKTIKMFETQDDKQTGIRSISNAKLPRNQALLVSGIIMLAAVPPDITPDKVMSANYDRLEAIPTLANGEFSIKANKKVIVPEGTSNNVFKTMNMTNVPLGYYKLANPRLIPDDLLIELTVELGSMDGIDPKTQLFVGLHGTITTP
jgi:hypothetical protein